ncbi:BatD family protein [Francisella adeliensis]|uniref:Protein BatD n=1 Tax=Francisella adeliensis TaxID=2007306 RepID=A0A2Z4Y1M4_9GAMM|nr:BatD family protein [Francisella adeliensis]AXA34768.1 aerotolerance protein BatD [Francisella adeliensis]MBK2086198.1 BatD family protein [Francisella adeliensis]MBK2096415.1 BatD family protein [Francisella adeliensis]QIW12726.1 protein BatD [Francisella adeliensis]QIW14602.1 protein BatD [Francisella adeliensis]
MKKISVLLALVLLSVSVSFAKVSASIDRTDIENGETIELTLHLENFNTQPQLDVLDKDFTVYNTSTNSKVSTVNGKTTAIYDMIVTIMPDKAGKLTIPAIRVGNQYTNPINIKVDKALTSDEQSEYQDIFAISTIARTKSYVNVPVLYTLKLYYSTPMLGIQPKAFKIRNAEMKPTSHQISYEKRINGKLYEVAEQSFLIIPHVTGKLYVPPMILEATLSKGFGQLGVKKESIPTKSHTLYVKPIPKDIRIKDWFPSSEVTMKDNWSDDKNVKVGNLLTRTVTIKAQGVLSTDIPKLDFSSNDDFNVYSEKPKLDDIEKSGKLTGTATYTVGYMPTTEGKSKVPKLELKWFDIDTHRSKIASIPVKDFDVKKGSLVNTDFSSLSPQKAQIVEKTVVDYYWRNIAILFMVLWVITLLLLLKCKLSKPKQKNNNDSTSNLNTVNQSSFKEVKKACGKKDKVALQQSLIGWASEKYDKEIFSLLEVAELMPEFKALIIGLNASIYADKEFNQYAELLEEIKKVAKSNKKTDNKKIKGLYE